MLAVSLAVSGIVSALVIRNDDRPAAAARRASLWTLFREMFRVQRFVVVFFWLVASAFLANTALNSLQFFARYFFQACFPDVNPDYALRLMGGVSLACTAVAAVGAGLLSDRIGRRRLVLASMFVSGALTLVMAFVTDFAVFLVLAALRSIATGPIVGVIPALAADLAPHDEAGKYMAYSNLSAGMAGAVASLGFGLVLTEIDRTGFMTLFIVSAALFVAGGALFLVKVPARELEAQGIADRSRGGDAPRR